MNVRREELRKSHPNATANEMTKIIGEDWNMLSEENRKPYMDAARIDKERYNAECIEYYGKLGNTSESGGQKVPASTTKITKPLKSQPQPPPKETQQQQQQQQQTQQQPQQQLKQQQIKVSDESSSENTDNTTAVNKTNGLSTPIILSSTQSRPETNVVEETKIPPRTGDYGIPIFTEEFLEHNKCVDSELRTLRKSNTDYEQQNSILEKHVDNMKNGIEKLVNESNEIQANNEALSNYLTKLKGKLATALGSLSIPGIDTKNNCIQIYN